MRPKLDALFFRSFKSHVPLWLFLAAVSAAARVAPLSVRHELWIDKAVVAVFLLSVTLAASRVLSGIIEAYAGILKTPQTTTKLTSNLIRIAVVGLGAMLLLSNLGISITPLLTALGVTSLAVALALQDTLGNFFAGIHIVASNLVEVGDYVKLDGGQEGVVAEVGWRTTRIQDLLNNHFLVPNAKLAQAVILNYHKPEPELAVIVPMGAPYAADLARMERTVLEAATEIQRTVPGAVPDFQPLVRFSAFADHAVQFSVILRAKAYTDRFLLTHEFIKAVHARLRKDGIDFPVPQRAVRLTQA